MDLEDSGYFEKISHLLKSGNYSQVIKQGEKYLGQYSEDGMLRSMISAAYLNLGNTEKAVQYSQEAVSLDPEEHYCFYIYGKILFSSNLATEALQYLNKAIELNPTDARCFSLKAGCLLQTGEIDKAAECVDAALLLDPELSSAQNFKVILNQLLSGKDQEHSPSHLKLDSAGFFSRAYSSFLNGKEEEAIVFLEESLRQNPLNSHAKRLLKECYKMRWKFYKKHVLIMVDARFRKGGLSLASGAIIAFFLVVYFLSIVVDLLLIRLPVNRLILYSIPFISAIIFLFITWALYPVSNLILLKHLKIWNILELKEKIVSITIAAGIVIAVITAVLFLIFSTKILLVTSTFLLTVCLLISSRLEEKPSGKLVFVLALVLFILNYRNILSLTHTLLLFTGLSFAIIILSVEAAKKVKN